MTRCPSQTITAQGCRKPPHQNAAPSHTPQNCPLQHSERSAVSYAVPADGIYPLRVTPLAARLKTARTRPHLIPANLHLAAIGTQRGIVCCSRRRNLSAARYSPLRTAENQRRHAAQDDAMPAKTHTAKDAASLSPEFAASHPRKTLTIKRAAKPPHRLFPATLNLRQT